MCVPGNPLSSLGGHVSGGAITSQLPGFLNNPITKGSAKIEVAAANSSIDTGNAVLPSTVPAQKIIQHQVTFDENNVINPAVSGYSHIVAPEIKAIQQMATFDLKTTVNPFLDTVVKPVVDFSIKNSKSVVNPFVAAFGLAVPGGHAAAKQAQADMNQYFSGG